MPQFAGVLSLRHLLRDPYATIVDTAMTRTPHHVMGRCTLFPQVVAQPSRMGWMPQPRQCLRFDLSYALARDT